MAARTPGWCWRGRPRKRTTGRRSRQLLHVARRPPAAPRWRQPSRRGRRLSLCGCAVPQQQVEYQRYEALRTIRLVSFTPFPAVFMAPMVRCLGAGIQRRRLQRAVGRPEPDAAVPAAAPPARARPVAPLGDRRPVADPRCSAWARSTTSARSWARSGSQRKRIVAVVAVNRVRVGVAGRAPSHARRLVPSRSASRRDRPGWSRICFSWSWSEV